MKHITEVLVHSNRCEVLNGHTFTVGDAGLPHIKLKFLYLFESTTLQGKSLECKYILPNGQYSSEILIINSKDELTFPIHYSCFAQAGWTTLKITLVDERDRITLQDIVIKCNNLQLGSRFTNARIDAAINDVIRINSASIEASGEFIKREAKKEIDKYIADNRSNLRGEQGIQGVQGIQGIQGAKGDRGQQGANGHSIQYQWRGTELGVKLDNENNFNFVNLKGQKGDKGEQGLRGEQGLQGAGITNIVALSNSQVRLEYGNRQHTIVNIPTVQGQRGERGLQGVKGDKGEQGIQGVGISNITFDNITKNLIFHTTDGGSYKINIPMNNLTETDSNNYQKKLLEMVKSEDKEQWFRTNSQIIRDAFSDETTIQWLSEKINIITEIAKNESARIEINKSPFLQKYVLNFFDTILQAKTNPSLFISDYDNFYVKNKIPNIVNNSINFAYLGRYSQDRDKATNYFTITTKDANISLSGNDKHINNKDKSDTFDKMKTNKATEVKFVFFGGVSTAIKTGDGYINLASFNL